MDGSFWTISVVWDDTSDFGRNPIISNHLQQMSLEDSR